MNEYCVRMAKILAPGSKVLFMCPLDVITPPSTHTTFSRPMNGDSLTEDTEEGGVPIPGSSGGTAPELADAFGTPTQTLSQTWKIKKTERKPRRPFLFIRDPDKGKRRVKRLIYPQIKQLHVRPEIQFDNWPGPFDPEQLEHNLLMVLAEETEGSSTTGESEMQHDSDSDAIDSPPGGVNLNELLATTSSSEQPRKRKLRIDYNIRNENDPWIPPDVDKDTPEEFEIKLDDQDYLDSNFPTIADGLAVRKQKRRNN
ncbi:hypothetical protein K440DRAFT_639090 [Wilcoxina mikolae CBS 423.85]|nr:hypothetical protein K440DRAFT_639090 [Wilcoxina mikolae CBS 423.85]